MQQCHFCYIIKRYIVDGIFVEQRLSTTLRYVMIQRLARALAAAVILCGACSPSTEYAYCVRHPNCVALIKTRLHASKEGRWEYVLVNYGPQQEAIIDIKLLLKNESGTPASKSTINGYCNTVNQTVEELGLRGNVQIRILDRDGKLVDDCRGIH